MVADSEADTATVVTVKVAEVLPLATATELGTVTPLSEEDNSTVMLPLPGAAFKTTVPVALAPPATGEGVTETDVTWNGLIVSVQVC
jgi:hypothetical protein